jgi:lipoprotein-anchoring transpeptidase ErfK/SrfK
MTVDPAYGEDRGMRRAIVSVFLAGALATGCSSAGRPTTPAATPSSAPTFAVAGPKLHSALQRHIAGAPVVAARTTSFRVFESPAGQRARRSIDAVNDWGQRLWLPVIGERVIANELWFRVRLPERPNGSTGWLLARDVDRSAVQDRIVVRLRRHTLTHYADGEMVRRFTVAVGKPSTPTAPGQFFVWARVGYQDTHGPYGNFALGLSGFSNVITDWPGGGRMAIHGTSDPTIAGQNVSNGCVRVFNPLMATLMDIPMGTSVVIRR